MVTFVLSYVKFHTAAEEQLSPHELVENDIISKQASKQASRFACITPLSSAHIRRIHRTYPNKTRFRMESASCRKQAGGI